MPNKATWKRLQLHLWTECVGTYRGLFRDQNLTCVKLGSFVIQFDDGSRQARAVQEALEEVRIGSRVGLLRTDSLESPLRVRVVSSNITTSVDRFKASRVGKEEG